MLHFVQQGQTERVLSHPHGSRIRVYAKIEYVSVSYVRIFRKIEYAYDAFRTLQPEFTYRPLRNVTSERLEARKGVAKW